MSSVVRSVDIGLLREHPGNPNRMSAGQLGKLVRNIERSGCYEPLVVRDDPGEAGCFQIINGHHRALALGRLGYTEVDVVVWDVDDEQVDVLLATLNRLGGRDVLDKRIALLARLREKSSCKDLAKLLPATAKQLDRLGRLKLPEMPAEAGDCAFAEPLVFFVGTDQREVIERALSFAACDEGGTRAVRNAAALTAMSRHFIEHGRPGGDCG